MGRVLRVLFWRSSRVIHDHVPVTSLTNQFCHPLFIHLKSKADSKMLQAGHGEWSFLQKQAGPYAPTHLDNGSVPIIRGKSTPGSPLKELRFADPRDLLSGVPTTDYCILHTADTVRTLFPRPKIEEGLNEITSVLSPMIADPYALVHSLSVTDKK